MSMNFIDMPMSIGSFYKCKNGKTVKLVKIKTRSPDYGKTFVNYYGFQLTESWQDQTTGEVYTAHNIFFTDQYGHRYRFMASGWDVIGPYLKEDKQEKEDEKMEKLEKEAMSNNEQIQLLCRNGRLKKPSNVTQTPDKIIHLDRGQDKEYKFQKGDRVCFHGVLGTVTSDPMSSGLVVTMDTPDAAKVFFYADGRYFDWEDKPSLVYVSRPKKKVKRMVSRWALYNDSGYLCSYMSKDQAQSDTFYAIGNKPLYLVELKGEYEAEED